MMAMPYGFGYGAGAAAADISAGMLRSQSQVPQIQSMNLANQRTGIENQERQMDLSERQAKNTAYGTTSPQIPAEQSLTPYDQQISDLKAAYNAVPQGQGMVKHEIQGKLIDLAHKQRTTQLGMGLQATLAQNSDQASKYFKASGLPIESIKLDPESGQYLMKMEGHDAVPVQPKILYAMATNPEMMSKTADELMKYDYYNQSLGLKYSNEAQKREESQRYHDMTYGARLKQIDASMENAKTAAQGRMGEASIIQSGAMQRFKMAPTQATFDTLTMPVEQGGMGYSAPQAQEWLNTVQQNRKVGKSDDQTALELAIRAHAGIPLDPEKLKEHATVIKQLLPQQSTKQIAPSAPPTATRPSAATSQNAPPVSKLKEGVVTQFKNGQSWTLKNGKPVRVK
jgi:hypothetical protein